jgi:hypothetical protein
MICSASVRHSESQTGRAPRSDSAHDWLAAALIAGFFLVNLIGLDRVPFINADEAWIAEPGLRFWQGDGFVSLLHGGFFGTERHYLLHAPLFSVIAGASIVAFGHGLIQVRLITLAMAALTAAFTYRLGRTLLSPLHGLIAVLLLTWCRTGPYQWEARQSGIVLTDFGRLARYDVAVPFFGALGFLLILPWLLRDRAEVAARTKRDDGVAHVGSSGLEPPRVLLVLAGACAGMATACHPMGLIWIATLMVACPVAMQARGERPAAAIVPVAWIALGAGLAMLPWLLLMLAGWQDMLAQQSFVAQRWTLSDPWFYVSNALTEWRRYISTGRGLQFGIPGAWLLAICSVAGVAALLSRSRRDDLGARLILAALVTGFLMLTFGEREKYFFYLAGLWPWIALTVAIAIVSALQSSRRILRVGAIVLLVLGCLDGVRAEVELARKAAARTPFVTISDRVAAQIPRDAKVLALPTWWFRLEPRVASYRSVTVPLFFAKVDPTGSSITERLDAIDADVMLFDPGMIEYVYGARDTRMYGPGARNPGAEELQRFVETRSARHVDITDPSYGRFVIHFLRHATSSRR